MHCGFTFLMLLFIALKVFGIFKSSWMWVFSPVWLPWLAGVVGSWLRG